MDAEDKGKTGIGNVPSFPGLNDLSLNRVKPRENSPFPFRGVNGIETEKFVKITFEYLKINW